MDLLIKNFPDKLQKEIKQEASKKGFTLKGYVISLLTQRRTKIEETIK